MKHLLSRLGALLLLWTLLPLSSAGVGAQPRSWTPPSSPAALETVPGRIVVGLRPSVVASARLVAQLSARVGPPLRNGEALDEQLIALEVDPASVDELIAQLRADPRVAYAEPDYLLRLSRTPNDPLYGNQWALPRIAAPVAWEQSIGAQGVTIAVIDSGVYANHPDLAGRVLPGRDFVNNDNNAADDNGHGTFVAGVIAGAGDDGVGIAGVCWRCTILPVKAMNNEGLGSSTDVARAIRWAVDQGAQVINLSLGGTRNPSVLREAIAYAESRGVLIVAASGNEALDGNPLEYPAAYGTALAVGATTPSDEHASFSNYGDHLDLAAPGVEVTSAVWTRRAPSGYATADGTSFAAPFVAGVAGLALGLDPDLKAGELRELLTTSADDLGAPGRDVYFGAGRVNAQRVIEAVIAGWIFPETGKALKGEFRRFWQQNGGLPIFGLPITDEFVEQTPEGPRLVQYFERNRFEFHPEQPVPYQVLLGRLGDTALSPRDPAWRTLPPSSPQPGCRFFAETGRNVCEPFLSYWRGHGLLDPRLNAESRSLALFGLPLTDARIETNASGDTVLTQWFERARFEDHGPNGVLLGLLGSETFSPAAQPGPPPAPACPDVPPPVNAQVAPAACVAVGTTMSASASGFAPGEPVSNWLNAPDGTVVPGVEGLVAADNGTVGPVPLSTAGWTAGQWVWVFQGVSSGNQALVFVRVD